MNSCIASAEGAAAATTVTATVINPSSPAGSAFLLTSQPQTTCLIVLPTHFLFLWAFHDSLLTTEVKFYDCFSESDAQRFGRSGRNFRTLSLSLSLSFQCTSVPWILVSVCPSARRHIPWWLHRPQNNRLRACIDTADWQSRELYVPADIFSCEPSFIATWFLSQPPTNPPLLCCMTNIVLRNGFWLSSQLKDPLLRCM